MVCFRTIEVVPAQQPNRATKPGNQAGQPSRTAAWPDITGKRVLAEPWSNETRHSRVDYRDVAEVAAIALLEDRLVNGTRMFDARLHGLDGLAALVGAP